MPCGTPSAEGQYLESDMAYLKPKATKSAAWLPTQVAYGVDCSDPEPKNWKPFGELVDQQQTAAAKAKGAAAAKGDLPGQSTPAG